METDKYELSIILNAGCKCFSSYELWLVMVGKSLQQVAADAIRCILHDCWAPLLYLSLEFQPICMIISNQSHNFCLQNFFAAVQWLCAKPKCSARFLLIFLPLYRKYISSQSSLLFLKGAGMTDFLIHISSHTTEREWLATTQLHHDYLYPNLPIVNFKGWKWILFPCWFDSYLLCEDRQTGQFWTFHSLFGPELWILMIWAFLRSLLIRWKGRNDRVEIHGAQNR